MKKNPFVAGSRGGVCRRGLLASWMALASGMCGCHSWDQIPADPAFLPGWDEASRALNWALTTWRDAPSPLPSSFDSASVKFLDKQRRPDQRLLAFQVLGRADVENARQFTVRLNLEREESPRLVRYNVSGRDPVWVFRLEDFERICHWEHDMTESSPGATGGATTAQNPEPGSP